MKGLVAILALSLVFAVTADAQVQTYGVGGAGAYLKAGGKGAVGMWAGAEIPISTDTTRGLTVCNRTGMFYADTPDDIQGGSTWLLTKARLFWDRVGLYGAIGGGILYEVNETDDEEDAALKVEFGMKAYKSFGFALGADFVPVKGGGDEHFIYLVLDLTPRQ